MSKQGSNSELFAHENDALTARPQIHNTHFFYKKLVLQRSKI